MSKRWTEEDDQFIFAYYETVGPFIGPHDLNRTEAAVKARYKHLKDTGAWDYLGASKEAFQEYRKLAGFKTFGGLEND